MSALKTNTNSEKVIQNTAKLRVVSIGVNYYQDTQINNLSYCDNDCQDLAKALKIANQDFQEIEIVALSDDTNINPTKEKVIGSLDLFNNAQPEDTILFYFSGHGYLDNNNQPVLCAADTQLDDLAQTSLSINHLLNKFRDSPARNQLIWLDACQEEVTDRLITVFEQQAQQSKAGQNFYAVLACDRQQRSWEFSELKHGVFTHYLIEGLWGKASNKDGYIEVDRLISYVSQQIAKFIEYRKHPLDSANSRDLVSRGIVLNPDNAVKPEIKSFPGDVYQTPRKIACTSGNRQILIGRGIAPTARKALVIDPLSASQDDLQLCKVLQAKGGFTVDYCFLQASQDKDLKQIIKDFLQGSNTKTLLLYFSGTIQNSNISQAFITPNHTIDLSWLSEELNNSPVREIIIISNLQVDSNFNLVQILNPDSSKSICIISATSNEQPKNLLLQQLNLILNSEHQNELWASELITQLQVWNNRENQLRLNFWLSGATEVTEILLPDVQCSHDDIFEIDLCPYKSLEAFTQEDAYFFHGRETLVTEILNKLENTAFLAVVGASGSGKSSLVRAGVIPQLSSCQTWVMRPGKDPLITLANTLAPNNSNFIEGVLYLGSDSFINWLQQQLGNKSILVIDQFEELFTLTSANNRVNFLNLILDTVGKAESNFQVIITLRVDFLENCLASDRLNTLINRHTILVPSFLAKEEYRQILLQPAKKVGLKVEDSLINLLLRELKTDSLPLLQFTLDELWKNHTRGEFTLKDYQENIGGLGKIIGRKAQETYDSLETKQQECAQWIFLSLVQLGEGKEDTRRRLPIPELRVDKYQDVFDATLNILTDARLLIVSRESNSSESEERNKRKDSVTVEVAHEILIRNWDTLRWWLDKNRDRLRLMREIEQQADKWDKNNQKPDYLLRGVALARAEELYIKYADELSSQSDRFIYQCIEARDKERKAIKRRRRQLIGGLTGGLITVSILASAAIWQLRQATINEINSLNSLTESLLASNRELDALLTGLKAGKKIQNSFFPVSQDTKIKIIAKLQNVFNEIKEINRLEGHKEDIGKVVFSPDGATIASITSKFSTGAVGDNDNTVKLWNTKGQLLFTLDSQIGYKHIAFSPSNEIIVTITEDNIVELYNLEGKLLQTLNVNTKNIYEVVFSPDSKFIIFQGEKSEIWNIKGELIASLRNIENIVFSPDGQTIASNTPNGIIKLWNLQGNLIRAFEGFTNRVNQVAFYYDSKTIITSDRNHSDIKVWNLNGDLLHILKGDNEGVEKVILSKDGKTITSIGETSVKQWNSRGKLLRSLNGSPNNLKFTSDHKAMISYDWRESDIKIWSMEGKLKQTLEGHEGGVSEVILSPDNQTMIALSNYGVAKIWNLEGELLDSLELHSYSGRRASIVLSPNGKTFASSGHGGSIKIWSLERKLLDLLHARNRGGVNQVFFSSDGEFIVSQHDDGATKLWKHQSKSLQSSIPLYSLNSLISSSSQGGTILASGHGDNIIKLWNSNGKLIRTIQGHADKITSLVFSPDGKIIASGSEDKTVKLWSLDGKLLQTLQSHTDKITSLVFSPDGKVIASGSEDKTVKLWSLDGKLLQTLQSHEHKYGIKRVLFSPDGKVIASRDSGYFNTLWDFNGKLIKSFKGDKLAFSSDSQIMAIRSGDINVEVRNIKGQIISVLQGHEDDIVKIFFVNDGKNIISASWDGTIKLWNTKGQLIDSLNGHTLRIEDIAISPDSQILASASHDETIKLWSLNLDDVLSRGCDWARDYLTNNPNVSEEDRKICN